MSQSHHEVFRHASKFLHFVVESGYENVITHTFQDGLICISKNGTNMEPDEL